MSPIRMNFIPLAPGEEPGDPALGGWRPLRPRFFTRHEQLRPSAVSFATIAAPTLSLKQAVQLVAARLWGFQLRQAIEIVAQRLAN